MLTISDGLMIVAVILGPILAVQVQKLIEKLRQSKLAKEMIFKTLMSTRGTPMALHHVQALNLIDLEFYGQQQENIKVIDAWKLFRDHLYNHPQDTQASDYKAKCDLWGDKSSDFLIELLFEMSKSLGYKYDKVLLKRGAYTPQGYFDAESAQFFLRERLVTLLAGKEGIPVQIVEKKTPD